jgi:CRISPR/Cas system CSM-associated protein Csm3 (group 7 of RAMP superfamily)
MSDASPRVIYDVTAMLHVLSPLHVGSGGTRKVASVKGKDGANDTPDVAEIIRDVTVAPYLPGTTIKGLLRRLAEARPGDFTSNDIVRLFGDIKGEEGKGRPGAVTVFGASRDGSGPDIPQAPFVAGAESDLGRGVFVAARTKIDLCSGTAEDRKLFHQEMVAQGTKFALRLRIDMRAKIDTSDLSEKQKGDHALQTKRAVRSDRNARADADEIYRKLLALLQDLCAEEGQAVGKGTADGFGCVKLDRKTLTVKRKTLTKAGTFNEETLRDQWNPFIRPAAEPLRFVCDGPFLIVDASKKPKAGENPEGERPHISAQSWNDELPMLLGTSVSGALRARARWLEMRSVLRDPDNKKRLHEIDDEILSWSKKTDGYASLSSVQRLFGITGFRGRLAIAQLKVEKATPWTVTSVKLDRFTGGPVDNALFKTRAFVGVKFVLSLVLENRPKALGNDEREADRKLYEDLKTDIENNGLMLGHGTNKGFGWFRLEKSR